jgi:hypothetical protein
MPRDGLGEEANRRRGVTLRAAVIAALLANLLDAISTWFGITHYAGREAGVLAWNALRAWGLIPGLLAVKGSAMLIILGIALTGTAGEPRWWRTRPHQQWVVNGALWIAAAWFAYLSVRNTAGAWMVYRSVGR